MPFFSPMFTSFLLMKKRCLFPVVWVDIALCYVPWGSMGSNFILTCLNMLFDFWKFFSMHFWVMFNKVLHKLDLLVSWVGIGYTEWCEPKIVIVRLSRCQVVAWEIRSLLTVLLLRRHFPMQVSNNSQRSFWNLNYFCWTLSWNWNLKRKMLRSGEIFSRLN